MIVLRRGRDADHSHIGQDGAIVYANKRAEGWGAMRAWLAGGMVPDDRDAAGRPDRGSGRVTRPHQLARIRKIPKRLRHERG